MVHATRIEKSDDLRNALMENPADWKSIASLKLANIHGIQNAPEGFIEWATRKGAVDLNDADWQAAVKRANGVR